MSRKSAKAAQQARQARDKVYTYDEAYQELQDREETKNWRTQPHYFKNVKVSSLASMKMLKHALAGVKKGQKAGGKPLEVMGLMLGKSVGDTVIIMDAYPLPVEGFETRVVADDDKVTNYMINLSEQLESLRPERFIGWYHSHPFDVGELSNCFFSSTDIQTQLLWQRTLDPRWVGIVIDPLRSIAKSKPEMAAFRVFPPEYAGRKDKTECPDGSKIADESARIARWGKSCNRYYQLPHTYFMSGLGSQFLDVMSKNHLWIRVLSGSAIMEPESIARFPDRVTGFANKLETTESALQGSRYRGKGGSSGDSTSEELDKGARASAELAIEQVQGHMSQLVKHLIFNFKEAKPKKASTSSAP